MTDAQVAETNSRRFYACIMIVAVNEASDTAHVAPVTFPVERTVPVALSDIRNQSGITDVRPGQWYEAIVSGYAQTAPGVRPDMWERSPELPDGWMGIDNG